MTAADFVRLARNPFERLLGALLDQTRCNRTMLALLIGYALIWALYGSIAHCSQDLHPDMTELIAWSRDLSLGYIKHPPLAAWLVRLWFSIVPLTDFSFYLLAMLMPTLALWIVWQLSVDYLELEKRVIAIALLMFVPFYNFHALKFNVNTVLLPTWAATTFWFLRSYKTGSIGYSTLTGLGAAASILAKYWSAFLIIGLILAVLIHSRRSIYFRSPAPWITVIVGFAVLGPHLYWLYQNNFVPIEYAVAKHGSTSITSVLRQGFSYLAGCAAYVAIPILVVAVAVRPSRAIMGEMVWPSEDERRLVAITFWGPILLPILAAIVGSINLTSLWSMPAWTLLPILLLSPPAIKFSPLNFRRAFAAALTVPLLMLIAAPVIAMAVHWAGVQGPVAHGRLLAIETERAWHQVTQQPLRFVGCDLADAVITYATDRPRSVPSRSFQGNVADQVYADAWGWPDPNPELTASNNAQLTQNGMALVCSAEQTDWVQSAVARASRNGGSQRIDVALSRNFMGIAGQLQRYVIFIIPPQQ